MWIVYIKINEKMLTEEKVYDQAVILKNSQTKNRPVARANAVLKKYESIFCRSLH